MNLGVNSMTSNASWKSRDAVSDQFPAGLRVLVVDDDPTCLRILDRMLQSCHYEVTKSCRAELALKYLKDNRDGFDIVISDVHMPDMDGFKLLELIGLDMDLPVIMMSADDSKNVVMKGVEAGACDYLIKPVRMEALKNIWQHVVRKKRHEWKEKDLEQSGSVEDGERLQKPCDDVDYSSSANEGNWKGSRKRKDEEDEGEDRDDSSTLKKQRVVWSTELHKQFVAAVNQLGIDKAVPKKILELMNVPGLTRENVASHLQKYRLYLRRLSGQPQNGLNPFIGPGDPAFGLDHLQSLRATNKSFIDQRNIFSFDNPNISFLDGQQPLNNGKQMNPLHGIPINPKQLATLHQSVQPYGNVHVGMHTQLSQSNSQLAQMVQPQPRTHMFNEVGNSTTTHLPSSVVQPPFSPYGIENVRTQNYTSLAQPSSVVEFSRTQGFTSKGLLQEELSSERKGSRSFLPNSYVFNDLSQNGTEDWSLQNVGSNFGTPQHGRIDVPPSVLVQPEFPSDLRSRLIHTTSVNKMAFSAAPVLGNNTNIEQQLGSSQGDNLLRVKAERLPEMGLQNNLFTDPFGQEDLMTALLKQQEGVVAVENEFGFDEYQLDDLPV